MPGYREDGGAAGVAAAVSNDEVGVTTGNLEMTREAGHLLYRFEGKLEFNAVGLVPGGLRMANVFEGVITEGILPGARVWGIDHLLVRPDGVSVIDAPKTLSLGNVHVHEHVRGYCLPPAGLEVPPLEEMLDPDFEWPDVLFPVMGFSTFATSLPELSDLNRSRARIDGWASFRTGALVVETRLIEHEAVTGPTAVPAVR